MLWWNFGGRCANALDLHSISAILDIQMDPRLERPIAGKKAVIDL
jgi:hypothetical protein